MKLAIITGVGPGHETIVRDAIASVDRARPGWDGAFVHHIIDDRHGVLGCPSAKNAGIDAQPDADWYFFLDADDLMEPEALRLNDFGSPATFGAVKLSSRPKAKNVWPCTFRDLAIHGSGGTLTMGFFCRGDVARAIRFADGDELTDDFRFYLALPAFTKIREPICTTRTDVPSSTGPKRIGADKADWTAACNARILEAIGREPEKFNIEPELILSQVAPH